MHVGKNLELAKPFKYKSDGKNILHNHRYPLGASSDST